MEDALYKKLTIIIIIIINFCSFDLYTFQKN
jgi:hypothetical protein